MQTATGSPTVSGAQLVFESMSFGFVVHNSPARPDPPSSSITPDVCHWAPMNQEMFQRRLNMASQGLIRPYVSVSK
jgi:hypothetical protein